MATFGYAGKILRVDLTSGKTAELSTLDHADRFLGGMGVAAKIYWDEVPPDVEQVLVKDGSFTPEELVGLMPNTLTEGRIRQLPPLFHGPMKHLK